MSAERYSFTHTGEAGKWVARACYGPAEVWLGTVRQRGLLWYARPPHGAWTRRGFECRDGAAWYLDQERLIRLHGLRQTDLTELAGWNETHTPEGS